MVLAVQEPSVLEHLGHQASDLEALQEDHQELPELQDPSDLDQVVGHEV